MLRGHKYVKGSVEVEGIRLESIKIVLKFRK